MSLTCFVAKDHLIEIVKVIIIIARGAQNLKWQVANNGRCAVVQEQELPLQAVS